MMSEPPSYAVSLFCGMWILAYERSIAESPEMRGPAFKVARFLGCVAAPVVWVAMTYLLRLAHGWTT
jgi:hypothetical protein